MKKIKTSKGDISVISRMALGIGLLILLSLMFMDYFHKFDNSTNLQNILETPAKYEGVYYQTSGRVVKVSNDFFYILDTEANKEVPVLYSDHNIGKGDNLVVYGPFTSGGYMIAANLRMQNSEPFKYGISLIAGLYFIWLFFNEWKLTRYGFEEMD